ncbi:MAG: hypothetical protein KJ826_01630 [Proteobacteria bacterium]|nr:hypothetical protein [Pseudomonadota bacterium]MBU4037683.1 hypothetical protein [Pseudomonadota bacterium]
MKKQHLMLKTKPLSQLQNAPFWSISALGSNINPRNTPCITAVKIFDRLELDQTETF